MKMPSIFLPAAIALLSMTGAGTAFADMPVAAQPYTSFRSPCGLLTPVKIGEWDLNGDGTAEWVEYEKTILGNWANHIVVVDFKKGCYDYPLDTSLSGDPNIFYTVSAVQMDDKPGDELIVRPRPTISGGGPPSWSRATRVIKQSDEAWYLVDYGALKYQSYNAMDYNGVTGADLSALGNWVAPLGEEAYYLHVFSLLPTPAFRQFDYPATVDIPHSNFAVRPYNGVLSGQLDANPGNEAAVVFAPINGTAGYVYIYCDRDKSTWLGSFAGDYGSYSAKVTSAKIESGQVKVAVSYINTLTPSNSYDVTFLYAVNYNTGKISP